MFDRMRELFLQNGLRPLSFLSETAELDRKVNRSELTALLVLHFRGQLTMSALASHLGVPLSTATSLVKRLVRKELVDRRQSAKDQRVMLVELTGEGLELAMQVKAVMDGMLARIQSALSQEELEQLLSLAVKALRAVQSKGSDETKGTSTNASLRRIEIDD
ncbi:MarR family winged helix-turn-helix transcriptional regulator [Paenibacillus humicola]|uniref:MarR family winged helix-turn-helix transcriptional regulator n=1 Tax=Paenibacillus humicola TaxID=3110540 RepID=UPI00237B0DB1|nr:MarR family transcriptional regulator [Paenibacillus humicola]